MLSEQTSRSPSTAGIVNEVITVTRVLLENRRNRVVQGFLPEPSLLLPLKIPVPAEVFTSGTSTERKSGAEAWADWYFPKISLMGEATTYMSPGSLAPIPTILVDHLSPRNTRQRWTNTRHLPTT